MHYKRILIAVDESKYSEQAAKAGIQLAEDLKADITLIYVVEPIYAMGTIDSGIIPINHEKAALELGRKTLESYVENYKTTNRFQLVVKEGDPGIEILKTAEEINADLIVIGRHGLESLRHLIFGGVVDDVATRTTHIPVMLVPFVK